MEIAIKTFKTESSSRELRFITEGLVEYVEYNALLETIAPGNKTLQSRYRKEIDKSYIKSFRYQEGERMARYVDVRATLILLRDIDDYEIHKSLIGFATRTKKNKYVYEQFTESAKVMISKWRAHPDDVLNVNKYDRLEGDFKHIKMDNEDIENLTTKQKAERYDELAKIRDERRKAKNTVQLTDKYKYFFESKNITIVEFENMINDLTRLRKIFKNKRYNNRANDSEAEEWKAQLATKFKVK